MPPMLQIQQHDAAATALQVSDAVDAMGGNLIQRRNAGLNRVVIALDFDAPVIALCLM